MPEKHHPAASSTDKQRERKANKNDKIVILAGNSPNCNQFALSLGHSAYMMKKERRKNDANRKKQDQRGT
jgi:hypothetical protein